MNPNKQRITNLLTGEELSTSEEFLAHTERIQETAKYGIVNDADAVLHALKIDRKISVVGVVGRSILQGRELRKYLTMYFINEGGLDFHKTRIANYIYGDIIDTEEAYMVLRSEDPRWRSFSPIKNIDEVMQQALDS